MEVLQIIFKTIQSSVLLSGFVSYFIVQCGKKKEPEKPPGLAEPDYPFLQPQPKPGVVPTEEQYIYFNYPFKRKPESKPSQEKIGEMLKIRQLAKSVDVRKQWGEEYCKTHKPPPGQSQVWVAAGPKTSQKETEEVKSKVEGGDEEEKKE